MKAKIVSLLLTAVFSWLIFYAQAQPGFDWAAQNAGDTLIYCLSVDIDNSGNQIMTGYFKGTVDFDPGAGTSTLVSAGREDIFIQKLDPEGNLVWVARMGDYSTDQGREVVTDASGNIYVTGYFWGTIDADPGPGTFFLSQNRMTSMVLKIAPDGNLIWAKQYGAGDMGHAYAYGLAVDNNLNVITCGAFYGKVDFDPGAGTLYLTPPSGVTDGFLHKLDADGNFVYVKQISGSGTKSLLHLETDAGGNIYMSGYFTETVDFNPDRKLKNNLTSFGSLDVFVEKFTPAGHFIRWYFFL
jgi:hypothetical protein